ncbi:glycosyltransferase family 4 protein [Flagellimonas marinaquae]
MSRLHIVIALPVLNQGGTEVQTLHLIRTLVHLGHKVTTICYFEWDEAMVHQYERVGSQVELLRWKRSKNKVRFVRDLKKVFKNSAPDVVHVQYLAPGVLPVVAAKWARVPTLFVTVHLPLEGDWSALPKFAHWVIGPLCRRIIYVSIAVQHSWGIPFLTKRIRHPRGSIIYNSIDVARLSHLREQLILQAADNASADRKTVRLGAVSRLRQEKGIDDLIVAFAELSHTNSSLDLELWLVGDGPDRKKYESLVQDLEISEKVIFFGKKNHSEAMQLMARLDIVVVPSKMEGFGLTAAEAMAMKIPLVVSNAHALPELIVHGEQGLVFKKGDRAALKGELQSLLNDSDEAKVRAENAYLKAREEYDISGYRIKIHELYTLE